MDNGRTNGLGPVLIRKKTMIIKNSNRIEEVYRIAKKPIGTGAYGVVSLC